MYTLIYTACLGLLCLALEILNLRRYLIPAVLVGLAGVFYVNYTEWSHAGPVIFGGIDMSHMISMDHYSVAFSGLGVLLTAMIILLCRDFYRKDTQHLSDYLSILLFVLCGALVLFSFNNLVMLFLGIEIVSISLYIMAGSRKSDIRSNEAGFKYFLMGSFASGFLLFGIALVFGATHSFELSKIAAFANTPEAMQPMFTVGALLMVFAMLFKVAAVPFHFWSPDVYEGSPTLVTAFMSTIVKVAFFAGFYKLMSVGFIGIHGFTDEILLIVTGVTLIFGNLVALSQQNFKRLLAYSGISHAGYMLLVILSVQSQPASALFFYGAVYALATIGAFAVAIPVFENTNREDISAFNGLGKTHPWVAGMLTLSMLSLAGIPPLAGFLGKYYVFSEAIRNDFISIVVIAVLTSIIGVYYYFKVILAMYVKPAEEARPTTFPRTYALVLLVCVGLSFWLGVWPGWLMGLL